MIIHMFDIGIRMIAFDWHSYVGNTWNLFDIFAICGSLATTIVLLFQPLNQAAAQFVIVRWSHLLLIHPRLQKLFLVGVLFKLAQRSDSLNQLFKIAVCVLTLMSNGKPINFEPRSSLPSIANLFMLWAAFFLVWALLFLELFNLTRWNWNETHNQNFATFTNAVLMLCVFSVG